MYLEAPVRSILFLIVNIFTGKIAITLILGWRLNECL
jgi:hypothetical protein